MKRNTHQKQTVLSVLKALRGHHPSAETVYAEVLKIIPSISRATVYRILNSFVAGGLSAKVYVPQSAERYDDWLAAHNHMLCSSCKQVVDLGTPACKEIALPKNDPSGCVVTGVEFIFIGICSKCAGK